MTERHDVVIAGGGPVGMLLGAELALAGVDVAIVERRETPVVESSRAGGIFARSIEILDQRGIADRFVEAGTKHPVHLFSNVHLPIGDFPSRHNYVLGLPQSRFELILADWVDGLALTCYRGRDVIGFTQDGDGVAVQTSDGDLHARFLVGCDGGRSVIRKQAQIGFPGTAASMSSIIAEAEFDGEPEYGMHRDEHGVYAVAPLETSGLFRLVVREPQLPQSPEATLEDLRTTMRGAWGTDFGLKRVRWISRFSDAARQAADYRKGRVLLAGDAAHIHSPVGGQGMGMGLQDAMNLGWKLALVVKGQAPDDLLDSYHDERHPVAASVLQGTLAQTALMRVEDRTEALRGVIDELIVLDEPRKLLVGRLSGLGLHYELGEHTLTGRRMPDLDLVTADGPTRMYTLLHAARPVLLCTGAGDFDSTPWADRVDLVNARADSEWELPVIGNVQAPEGVLVRPDGYVAWAGELDDAGLPEALVRWFGPA